MVKAEIVLDIKPEFVESFLDELKSFDGKHYIILKLKVQGEKQK